MPADRIAVLRSSLEALVKGLDASDMPSPFEGEGWAAYRGASGAVFHAAAIDGGALIVPFGVFEAPKDLALAVRGALGAALDLHDDSRGLFVVAGDTLPAGGYDAVVAGEGAFVPVPDAADPGLNKEVGWSFAGAASMFYSAEGQKRADGRAEADPLASAQGAFDEKLAARDDRGAMRRNLSAALNHELDHSSLAKIAQGGLPEELTDEIGDRMRRAMTANPDTVTAMENTVRTAVQDGILREEEIDPARVPPPAEATEQE